MVAPKFDNIPVVAAETGPPSFDSIPSVAIAPDEKETDSILGLAEKHQQDLGNTLRRYAALGRLYSDESYQQAARNRQREKSDAGAVGYWYELIDAVSRGSARVGSALYRLQGAWVKHGKIGGPGSAMFDPTTIPDREQMAEKLRVDADTLWEIANHPELTPQDKGKVNWALNLSGETLPYIGATTIAYMLAGPFGAFVVGGTVEGHSSYQEALDEDVDPATAELIGLGVGIVSGAIESVGGAYTEQMFQKVSLRVKNKLLRRGAKFTTASLVESLEEGGQEIAAIFGEEVYRDVDWEERATRIASAMAGGLFLGGTMKGMTIGARRLATQKQPLNQQELNLLEDELTDVIREDTGLPEPQARAAAQDAIDQKFKMEEPGEEEVPPISDIFKKAPTELTEEEEGVIKEWIDATSIIDKEGTKLPMTHTRPTLLRRALDKMPIFKGRANRHLMIVTADEVSQYKEGETITEDHMVSATKLSDEDAALQHIKGSVILRINSKTGRDISQYNAEEQEIVFMSGTQFKVTKIRESTRTEPEGYDVKYREVFVDEVAAAPSITEATKKGKFPPLARKDITELHEGMVTEEEAVMEAEAQPEAAEVVEPNLYIGNLTQRAKRVLGSLFGRLPEDVRGYTEEGFPTKRAKITMTAAEAEAYLAWLEEDLLKRLDENKIQTENQLARANADWGDIVALRQALNLPLTKRPFTVARAEKYQPAIINKTQMLVDTATKEELVNLAKTLELDATGTKEEIASRIEKLADEGQTKAQKIVQQAQEKVGRKAVKVLKDTKSAIWSSIEKGRLQESKMTVGEVLKATLRRSAKYAREAWAKGRQELRQKIRVRQRARKRMNRAMKVITSPIPKSVDFYYREAIDAITYDVNLKAVGPKSAAQRKATLQAMERGAKGVENMPRALIHMVAKTPVHDLTIEQLEKIAAEKERLIEEGKAISEEKQKPLRTKIKLAISQLRKAVSEAKRPKDIKGPLTKAATKKTLWEQFVHNAYMTLTPSRLFDMLDGAKGTFSGLWHRLFYDQVKNAKSKAYIMAESRKRWLGPMMKKHNIRGWDLGATRLVNDVRHTTEEVIGIYLANKDPDARLRLIHAHQMSEKHIKDVIVTMSEGERDLADAIRNDFEANYGRTRRATIEQENRDMGLVPNYYPIRQTGVVYPSTSEEIETAITYRFEFRRINASHGFTIPREAIPEHLLKPIRLDAITLWTEQVDVQERYIHIGPLVREMNSILQNKSLRNDVEKRFGPDMLKQLDGYVKIIANPYIYRQFTGIEKYGQMIRKNAAVAYLGINGATMLKQAPSLMFYLKDAGPGHLLASLFEFMSNPMEMIRRVRSMDPELAQRSIEREFEELKSHPGAKYLRRTLGKYAFEGIFFIDNIVRTIGWNAVYQRAKADDVSDYDAVRQARDATLRTQPAAAAEDIPSLYRTNEVVNWFLMYTNQLNKIYNMAAYDVPSYFGNKQYTSAALNGLALGIGAIIIWMISHWDVPDEPKDVVEAIGEQAINAIPLFGKTIMAARKGWESDIPAFAIAQSIGVGVTSLEEFEFTKSDAKQIGEGIAVLVGLPYVAAERTYRAVEEGRPSILLGAKRKKSKGKGKRRISRRRIKR